MKKITSILLFIVRRTQHSVVHSWAMQQLKKLC